MSRSATRLRDPMSMAKVPPRGRSTGRPGQRRSLVALLRQRGWLLGVLALALAIGQLPLALAACCAPASASGLGTVWFVNDFAQYESAIRQGATQPGWLIFDVFTGEPHQPAFMFTLYVAIGKVAAGLHLPPMALERTLEVVARALFVLALWRFCRAFARGRLEARWAFILALFGSGFEVLAALGGASAYTGNWSYETNAFGLLFAAPHVPLAMAATVELGRDGLRPRRLISARQLCKFVALGAVIALLHPFHLPVLLGAMALTGVVFWRIGRGRATLIGAMASIAGALPVLWPTLATFSLEPFWAATYSLQNRLPSPLPHELFVDLGPTLVLALIGAAWLRGRVAPFGLLLWLLLLLVAMYLPVPYQRRLGFGLEPTLAVLAANTLVAATARLTVRRAAALRLGVIAAALSSTLLLLGSVVSSSLVNAPLPVYRSTPDLDAAAAWLDSQAQPGQIIMADWETANYLGPRTPARVFGGHPVATLNAAQKKFTMATVFAHSSTLLLARSLGAQWLVYGPAESSLTMQPEPDFQSGPVRVFRVTAQ